MRGIKKIVHPAPGVLVNVRIYGPPVAFCCCDKFKIDLSFSVALILFFDSIFSIFSIFHLIAGKFSEPEIETKLKSGFPILTDNRNFRSFIDSLANISVGNSFAIFSSS